MATKTTSETTAPAFDLPPDMKFTLKRHFDEMAPHYDAGFGKVWRNDADHMIAANPVPITEKAVVHDNGCGKGQVTERILNSLQAIDNGDDLPQI